jgi:salicylate hydroxylase
MSLKAVIAGGGIGGLAAALALARGGMQVDLLERAEAFAEVGAGVQLGPNVTHVLKDWGLLASLKAVAASPQRLTVRSALSARVLAQMDLGSSMLARYGAPYLTLHRADLHASLLAAAKQAGATVHLGSALQNFSQSFENVSLHASNGTAYEADLLVAADGLWSGIREQLLGDGPPTPTGHLAYRALTPQSALPASMRNQDISVWLGPKLHVVCYPVHGGESLNLVVIVHGQATGKGWDFVANAKSLAQSMGACCKQLRELIAFMPEWRLWPLNDRPPMQSAKQQAQGRVALLGDAAHPMRPYLAQGAGMAIEDAAKLGSVFQAGSQQADTQEVASLVELYASLRWQRNARVQAKARRNGQVFHASGVLRVGRDIALKLAGAKLMAMPWLYGANRA